MIGHNIIKDSSSKTTITTADYLREWYAFIYLDIKKTTYGFTFKSTVTHINPQLRCTSTRLVHANSLYTSDSKMRFNIFG